MSAAETNIKKLRVEQAQALRILALPVFARQLEVGEMPLGIRRVKICCMYVGILGYLQGHSRSHSAKAILQECGSIVSPGLTVLSG